MNEMLSSRNYAPNKAIEYVIEAYRQHGKIDTMVFRSSYPTCVCACLLLLYGSGML